MSHLDRCPICKGRTCCSPSCRAEIIEQAKRDGAREILGYLRDQAGTITPYFETNGELKREFYLNELWCRALGIIGSIADAHGETSDLLPSKLFAAVIENHGKTLAAAGMEQERLARLITLKSPAASAGPATTKTAEAAEVA